ncbi:hypothetical protein HLB44_15895 [Aquincola sp. S2]|uniref:Type III effector protein n=1 Tax=Pseudaquabacterium terrae TaxID=2732868 RepID=A0ABX2EIK7_9BURK|nr:hypothetical protein [Aquabacterium terrae]NRF68477.1 hypothetical protein [Aquabacterium terrae]
MMQYLSSWLTASPTRPTERAESVPATPSPSSVPEQPINARRTSSDGSRLRASAPKLPNQFLAHQTADGTNQVYSFQSPDGMRLDVNAARAILERTRGPQCPEGNKQTRSMNPEALEWAVPPGPDTPFARDLKAAQAATKPDGTATPTAPDPELVKHADNFAKKDATIGDRMKAWKALCQAADADPASLPQPFGALVAEGIKAMAGTGQAGAFQKSLERSLLGKPALESLVANAHEVIKGAAGDTNLGKALSRRLRQEIVGPNSDSLMRRELLTHAAEAYVALQRDNPQLAASWNGTVTTALHRSLRYDGATVDMLVDDKRSKAFLEAVKTQIPSQ